MWRALALWCVLPAPLLAQAVPAAALPDGTPVAITNVTIVDVARGRRVPGQTVVVQGATIAAAGPAAGPERVRVPAGARLVPGRGKFLIPGLWDMHVHIVRTWN